VSDTPCGEHLSIDSAPVVPDSHAKLAIGIVDLELDALCLGMTKGIDQSFSSNPVNLMLDEWLKRLLPASDNDAEVNVGPDLEFLLNTRQCNNQV
jgi:hypothetical protein